LSDGHDISDSESEGGGAVSGEGLVTLLKSVVLLDEMEVIASDDDGSLHLVRDNNTPKFTINALGTLLFINIAVWDLSGLKTRRNSSAHNSLPFRQRNLATDDLLEDFTSDGNIAGEGALVVDVVSLNGGLGSLETYNETR
jgi:hypothetical protein